MRSGAALGAPAARQRRRLSPLCARRWPSAARCSRESRESRARRGLVLVRAGDGDARRRGAHGVARSARRGPDRTWPAHSRARRSPAARRRRRCCSSRRSIRRARTPARGRWGRSRARCDRRRDCRLPADRAGRHGRGARVQATCAGWGFARLGGDRRLDGAVTERDSEAESGADIDRLAVAAIVGRAAGSRSRSVL